MEEQLPVRVHNKDKPYIAISSFPSIMVHFPSLCVDKTLLVEKFLSGPNMSLVLRPRRFGKSINLSMLSEFFSPQNDKATFKRYFEKTLIYSNPLCNSEKASDKAKSNTRTRPVIRVSFHVGPITILQ
jgi:Predicted AAA-ATPase